MRHTDMSSNHPADALLVRALYRAIVRQCAAPVMDAPPAVPGTTFLLLEEFLVPQELHQLLAYTLENEQRFRETQVIQAGHEHGNTNRDERRSRALYEFDPIRSMFVERLSAIVPYVFSSFERTPFPVRQVEAQLTATGDGEFFKTHNDNTHELLQRREITFVYYFHREPKPFTGGELRLYESYREGDRYRPGQGFTDIGPQQNQLVLFPSYLMHEVRTTHVPSRMFADSRFTINGWLHR
jgi:SM-20-related protein